MPVYKNIDFICFTGIDGSGKTTMAKFLTNKLKEYGYNYEYKYSRFRPIIAKFFVLVARLLFLRKTDIKNYQENTEHKKALSRLHPLVNIYELVTMFDYFLQTISKIQIPLLLRKKIICDRYFYDTLITDIAVDMNYSPEQIEKKLRRYKRFFPTPELLFLVDLPATLAFQRKKDVPCIEYLLDRQPLYQTLTKIFKTEIIDGSKNPGEVQSELLLRFAQVKVSN